VLKFNADGDPANKQKNGPWTLFSRMEVGHAEVRSDHTVVLRGRRVFVRFDASQQGQLFASDQNLRLEVRFPELPDMPSLASTFKKIFLAQNESIANIAPPFWQAFFQRETGRPNWELQSSSVGRREMWIANRETSRAIWASGKVAAPHATFAPDPFYDDLARGYHVSGTAVLWCVVNERGAVEGLQIMKPLGMGLDERAIEAVSRWRFHPATQNGVPVAVQINSSQADPSCSSLE
jgi:TonB family protein